LTLKPSTTLSELFLTSSFLRHKKYQVIGIAVYKGEMPFEKKRKVKVRKEGQKRPGIYPTLFTRKGRDLYRIIQI